LESRLAWIFGSPRSGSTWLLELLAHPLRPSAQSLSGVAAPRRRAALRHLLNPRAHGPHGSAVPIDEPYLPQHLQPLIPFAFDPRDLSSKGLMTLDQTRGDDPHYFFSRTYADAWRPALRELILARFAAQVERVESEHPVGGAPVVVKEPNGSYGAPLMMSVLPRARLIFLVRDGRDVIDSFMDAMSGGGWLHRKPGMGSVDTPEERLRFARTEARSWLERTLAVERAFDAHEPRLRWRLRYEDLRADTVGTLRPLVDWLGLKRSDSALRASVADNAFEAIPADQRGRGSQRRAATPGLWREHMGDSECEAMEEIIGPKLRELGYEA